MQRFCVFLAFVLTFLTSDPAFACRIPAPLSIGDVKYADVVLVGRISNYRIVRDEAFRRKMLDSQNLPVNMRKLYEGPNSLMTDYARFDVKTDKLLMGRAPKTLSVTWSNSTFALPKVMAAGPFLIALRQPNAARPPLGGPSATIAPNPAPDTLTILQAPCSRPFIFEVESEEAIAVRRILRHQTR